MSTEVLLYFANFNLCCLERLFQLFINHLLCPNFDYGDAIYDQSYNDSFHAKLKSYQYKAALAIFRAIKRSYTEKLYQKLGIEHLRSRH